MPQVFLDNVDDPRLEPYRQLRTRNLTQFSAKFVVESKLLTQRLVRSSYEVESVLIDDIALAESAEWLPPDLTTYVVPRSYMSELLGFNFHRGVLGCGRRKRRRQATDVLADKELLDQIMPPIQKVDQWTGVYVVGVQDPENLGLIARTCSALGVRDLIIGPECVDPFARRVLRVSMGCMFNLQLSYANDPLQFLEWAKTRGIRSLATSLSDDSKPLEHYVRDSSTLVVMGNEANGLPEAVQAAAADRVRIDMELGTDSLNVSVATGIVLHYITRLAN